MLFFFLFFLTIENCNQVGCTACNEDDICTSCADDYYLYNKKCYKIDDDCYGSGCKKCIKSVGICVECKENFVKIDDENPRCKCKEGYALDTNNYEREDRCVNAFPKECPTGCICKNNDFICTSCQEDYLAVLYEDYVTIKSCEQTYECPSDVSNSCKRCDNEGRCTMCKDGYFLSISSYTCVLKDENIKCEISGCIQCSPNDDRNCDVCADGYILISNDSGEYNCRLAIIEPKKVLYYELTDNNIISENENDITIKLNEIEKEKQRPYSYTQNKNEKTIYINNDDSLDFNIICKENIIINKANNAKINPSVKLTTSHDTNIISVHPKFLYTLNMVLLQ